MPMSGSHRRDVTRQNWISSHQMASAQISTLFTGRHMLGAPLKLTERMMNTLKVEEFRAHLLLRNVIEECIEYTLKFLRE